MTGTHASTAAPAGINARPETATTARPVRFPEGFLWGAATSSYQIEGAIDQDGRKPSIWDVFCRVPGKVLHGDTGDKACDHYNRLVDDLDLMKELGLRAYRFSVAWPRIQPDGIGPVNSRGMDFYERLVDGLLERGIAPALTLYHWDLPQTLGDLGGWTSRDTASRFADYADLVALSLGDRVKIWMTLNEPWVSAWMGYGSGRHAPGVADLRSAAVAHHHLLLGHGQGLARLRSRLPKGAQVGVALSLMSTYPASEHPDDVMAASIADGQFNRSCLDPIVRGTYPDDIGPFSSTWLGADGPVRAGDMDLISAPIDFLGVNSYSARTVTARGRLDAARAAGLVGQFDPVGSFGMDVADVVPIGTPVTDIGWPVVPSGMRDLLVRLQKDYGLPVYITENGAAYPDYITPEGLVNDPERIEYLDAYLRAVGEAIWLGADVRGYFLWSLFDNFEWGSGYAKRFGIVYVDYPTSRRIPKSSARWYGQVIRTNSVGTAAF
ncbi:MAG: family 1 glycosylhydrolase [Candidatus Limnocylindrales bacterium]|jgi:beta-glucosidase